MKTNFINRFIGWIIDKFFIFILFFIIGCLIFGAYKFPGLLGYINGSLSGSTPENIKNFLSEFALTNPDPRLKINFNLYYTILYFIFCFSFVNRSYYLISELMMHRTLGKKIMKLYLADIKGNMLSTNKIIIRALSYWLLYFIIFYMIFSLLFYVADFSFVLIISNLLLIFPSMFLTKGKQTLYDLLSFSQVVYISKKELTLKDTIVSYFEKLNTINESNS